MSERLPTAPTLAGMAAALALFYWGGALPLAPLPQIIGLLIFAELAFLRPDLGLLAVPFAAPLYLIPAAIAGLRAEPLRFPLHEVALLATAGATGARLLWDRRAERLRQGAPGARDGAPGTGGGGSWAAGLGWVFSRRHIPHALLLLAGAAGVALAVPEGRGAALREFRWLIVEPLVFYALLRLAASGRWDGEQGASAEGRLLPVALALVAGGAAVALLGLLQFVGLDLVPLIGAKQSFSENVVVAGEARRVASVYGHPNNLGLLLGRVWPLAAALALLQGRPEGGGGAAPAAGRWPLVFGAAALVCLAGILVSFSRGAWLGALAAAGVLAAGVLWGRGAASAGRRSARAPVLGLVALVALAGLAALALALRGGLGGGSADARVLLWREAAALIQAHPLGLGLDQFYYYHNPEFGRSIIDPSLLGTSEQFASHPHNLVLDAWLNLGPLGVAALAWLAARGVRGAARGVRGGGPLALGALAAMAAALVHGTIDVYYFAEDLAIIFWLLLAIAEE